MISQIDQFRIVKLNISPDSKITAAFTNNGLIKAPRTLRKNTLSGNQFVNNNIKWRGQSKRR